MGRMSVWVDREEQVIDLHWFVGGAHRHGLGIHVGPAARPTGLRPLSRPGHCTAPGCDFIHTEI